MRSSAMDGRPDRAENDETNLRTWPFSTRVIRASSPAPRELHTRVKFLTPESTNAANKPAG